MVFLCALVANWLQLSDVRRSVRRATETLDTTSNQETFFERFESLGDRFAREPLFANPWGEFSKTVVVDPARQLVRSTRRPHEFFNTSSLIAPRINLRLFSAMPGYLISLGLFFTFIGLVAAIAIAAKGLGQGADVTQTQEALVRLLDVASLKFISSVTGIALSIILSVIQKSWLNSVMMMVHRFCSELERRTQSITTEQLLLRMFDALDALAAAGPDVAARLRAWPSLMDALNIPGKHHVLVLSDIPQVRLNVVDALPAGAMTRTGKQLIRVSDTPQAMWAMEAGRRYYLRTA